MEKEYEKFGNNQFFIAKEKIIPKHVDIYFLIMIFWHILVTLSI